MKLFIADESSSNWDQKIGFFLYGGIIIDESEARQLAEHLLQIKETAGLEKSRPIKWSNENWGKKGKLDKDLHSKIKKQILDVVASSESKIIVCLSPHNFYHVLNPKKDKFIQSINPATYKRTLEYGLNNSLIKFDSYLSATNNVGMVLVDRFDDSAKSYMAEHCIGLYPEYKIRFSDGSSKTLKRIVHPIIQLDNELSYLHQFNDVVLGAICWSLREGELNFLPVIKNNFWCSKEGEPSTSIGRGFNVYPSVTKDSNVGRAKSNLQQKFLRRIL